MSALERPRLPATSHPRSQRSGRCWPGSLTLRRLTLGNLTLGSLTLCSGLGLFACAPYEPYPVCDFRQLHGPIMAQGAAGPTLVPMTEGALVPMPLDTVNVTDENIVRKIMVQSVRAQRTETRTLQVSTQLVNCTDHALQVEGRTQFFDAGLAASEPPSAWQRLHVAARTIATYGERSIGTDKAVAYLIELREGR